VIHRHANTNYNTTNIRSDYAFTWIDISKHVACATCQITLT